MNSPVLLGADAFDISAVIIPEAPNEKTGKPVLSDCEIEKYNGVKWIEAEESEFEQAAESGRFRTFRCNRDLVTMKSDEWLRKKLKHEKFLISAAKNRKTPIFRRKDDRFDDAVMFVQKKV